MNIITMMPPVGLIETYCCGSIKARGQTDALRSLLRRMVIAGMSGPARVEDTFGNHRMSVTDIGRAARWSMTETDRDGMQVVPFRGIASSRLPARPMRVKAAVPVTANQA